jgi:S-adenosylmethionine hydrolase
MADRQIITLLTDFGLADGFIGAMKGVILDINPDCRIIDLTHHIQPHDVMGAALVLGQTYSFFPTGTIHVAVVDPGVGGERKPLVLEAGDYLFVGPDNGIFTFVLRREQGVRAFELVEERFRLPRVSQTFHGRDIFAPAAAHLSQEIDPQEMGPLLDVSRLTTLAVPVPLLKDAELSGEVIWVDSFGNLVTNISQEDVGVIASDDLIVIDIAGERIQGLKTAYDQGQAGEIIALWGSAGFLEIALKGENLSRARQWERGEPVRIRRKE